METVCAPPGMASKKKGKAAPRKAVKKTAKKAAKKPVAKTVKKQTATAKESSSKNPSSALNWFEIPVADFERAHAFYEAVLAAPISQMNMDPLRMGMLPADRGGIGGAIVAGPGYVPGSSGALVYLNGGDDLSIPMRRVEPAGGKVILSKTRIGDGEWGYMALIQDTEGNRVGLHSMH